MISRRLLGAVAATLVMGGVASAQSAQAPGKGLPTAQAPSKGGPIAAAAGQAAPTSKTLPVAQVPGK